MDVFKEFLESSTIGGLNFISSTKNFVRLFWICVVAASFAISFYEIHALFQDWNKNPIKSTTEIRVCLQKALRLILLRLKISPCTIKTAKLICYKVRLRNVYFSHNGPKLEIHQNLRLVSCQNRDSQGCQHTLRLFPCGWYKYTVLLPYVVKPKSK